MDAAFPTGKFPGHTTAELQLSVARHEEGRVTQPPERLAAIKAEIARREAVKSGDVSKMTPGERLRHAAIPSAAERKALANRAGGIDDVDDPKVERVAVQFSRNLLDAIGAAKLTEAARLNTTDEYRPGACASHDFCDANVFMGHAIEKELGLKRGEFMFAAVEGDDPNVALWNDAWNLAVERGFYVEQLTKFQAGQTYSCVSIGDSDITYRYEIVARTAKTLTIRQHGDTFKRGVSVGEDGVERCKPNGTFSMCPVIHANRRYEEA